MSKIGQSRWISTTWRGAAMLAALVGAMASPARAGSTLVFDPNGALAGGPGPVNVVTFDEDPGNALIVNAVVGGAPNVGVPLDVFYQATITTLTDANSVPTVNYGAAGNVTGTLTITAHFREVITSVTPTGGGGATITLSGAGVAQPVNEVNIYFTPTNNAANNLLGTGFVGPTLVYQGTANPDASGSFSTPNLGTQALDQFAVNNYPGLLSIPGDALTASGGTALSVTTTFANPSFFISPSLVGNLGLFFNTSITLPFHQVDPASMTYNGIPAAGTPGTAGVGGTIGPVNGLSGPNELLQADANSSFEPVGVGVVPEPGTVYTALTGIGLASLAGLRAQRRRNKTSAA